MRCHWQMCIWQMARRTLGHTEYPPRMLILIGSRRPPRRNSSVTATEAWQEGRATEGASLIDSRLALIKTKLNERGGVVKCKQGLLQRLCPWVWHDYFNTYSLVVRLTSLRTLLTIVVAQNLRLYQINVDIAFHNGGKKTGRGYLHGFSRWIP